MNISLIKYNLSYYVKTLRFIGPCLLYIVFFFINYQFKRIGIWDNCYITAVAIFVLSNWIGTSFVNSEDKTQQYITRLHVINETTYHISKIISILVFMLPFYILVIFYPITFGFFTRNILPSEILVCTIIHFLFSLMGVSISIFFNSDLLTNKNMTIPIHAFIILITIIPITLVFKDNIFVKYIAYLLPPVNFLTEKLYSLNDEIYSLDYGFLIFVIYATGYSLILIALYCIIIQRKNKE